METTEKGVSAIHSIRKVTLVILFVILLVFTISCGVQGGPSNDPNDSSMHQNSDDLSATDPTWGLNPEITDYPTIDPPPIPPPPQDPISPAWAEMENRHYSGTTLCPLGKLTSLDDSYTLIENRIYPIYNIPVSAQDELTALFSPLTSPESTLRFREQLAIDQTTFGALFIGRDSGKTELDGFARYDETTGGWVVSSGSVISGTHETGISYDVPYRRASLVMTASLAEKLEAVGFRPETTNSLWFSFVSIQNNRPITGILFYNDVQEYVLPTCMSSLVERMIIYENPDGNLLPVHAYAKLVTDNGRHFFPKPLAPGENPDT